MKLLTLIVLTSALYSCGASDDSTSGVDSPAVQASAKDTSLDKIFVGDYKMDCNSEYSAVVSVNATNVKTVLTNCSGVNVTKPVTTDYAYRVVEDLGNGRYNVELEGRVFVWTLVENVLTMGNAQLKIEPKFLKQGK